jgi:hypothetical protein
MAQKVGAGHTELVLRQIPGQVGEWRREHQGRHRGRRRGVAVPTPLLHAASDEVVGITTTPRGLRAYPPSALAGRRRTRTLATADAAVGDEPSTTDAAGPLRAHPQMLAATADNQSGPLLVSNPGSILASAEAMSCR